MSGGWALFVTCDADTGSDTIDLWGEGNVSPISLFSDPEGIFNKWGT